MTTQASPSLVFEDDVTVITDATAPVGSVGEWRVLAGTAATDHLQRARISHNVQHWRDRCYLNYRNTTSKQTFDSVDLR